MAAIVMRDLMGRITIKLEVTGVRTARARMWLGLRLMRLGAEMTGCNVEVSNKTTEV